MYNKNYHCFFISRTWRLLRQNLVRRFHSWWILRQYWNNHSKILFFNINKIYSNRYHHLTFHSHNHQCLSKHLYYHRHYINSSNYSHLHHQPSQHQPPHKPQQPSSLPPHKQFSSRHQHKQQTWKASQLYHPYYHCHSYHHHHHHQPQVNKNKPSEFLKESVAMTSLPRESVISLYIIGCIIILSRISVSPPILKELIAIIAVAGYFYSTIGLLFLIGYHSFMTVYYMKQYGADILTFGKKY